LEWTGYNEGTTDFLGADHAEADQVVPLQVQLGSAISIMDASDLAIPSTYFFNAATEEGRRWCPVTFNLPPSGGACTATATGASDAQMPLEVVCEGFFDEHAPLTYAVGFEVAVAGQEFSFFGKPVFDNKQTVHVLSIPARIHVRITDRLGSFVSTMVVVDGATSQVQQNLDDSLIRDILRAARTEGEVQRSIINVVQNAAATVQTAKHDTLLLNLLSRLLSTVKSSPPSPDIAMRVVQTLLVFFNASLPIAGYSDYMNETTELLLTILYPNSLPSGLLSEVEVRQSSALASNIYAQYLQRTNVSSMPWDHAFAVAMEKFGSVMAKKALCNLAPVDPMVEIQEDHFILTLRKVALSSLEGAEMNFPILQDGTTISLVLPAKLPPALSQLTTADVQMVQHRALWTAGGEVLLSYPVSLSVSAAGEADVSHVDFGDQEVHVVLPFNASMLSPNDVQRVYRREGVSCVTWQGDVNQEQPWSSKGCRIETIRVATDETGADVIGLGSVVCACSHMSTFALSWREEAVRFESPTPDTGDLFVLTAGHVLRFHVSALATASAAKKTILLSQLGIQPVPTRSFTNLTLIPAVATSDLQEQADASLTRVNATLSWTPMIAGSYSLSLGLFADGELIETRHWRVRVIFCEHFVRSGEDLQAIANVHGTSWQALYGINPQLRQSSDLSVQTNVKYGRLWSCDPPLRSASGGPVHYQTETEEVKELFDHGCAILAERQPIGDRIVRVGLVLGPLQASQNIPSLVRDVGGSLRQTLAMNPSRIHLVSKNPLIADMMHPHGDGRLCVVSSLSQECPALPY